MDTKLFGRHQPGGLFSIVDRVNFPTGDIWWVGAAETNATNSVGAGRNPDVPFSTLAYAITQAAAGDTIFLMPAHTEAIAAATTLDVSKAGLSIIGLGVGTRRPRFTNGTAVGATFNVTGANVLLEGFDIATNFLNVAAAMTVGTAADGLTIRNVNFYDTSVVLGALIGINVAATVADITLDRVHYYGIALTAPATNFMLCAGAVSRLTVRDCYVKGDFSDGIIVATATASTDVLFKDLLLINMSETGKGINLNAATTGAATEVQAYLEDDGANEKAITGAALFMTDRVKQTNVVTASTYLCIAADS